MAAIDAYEEQVFWKNLASKLGRRDLAAEEALRAEPRDEEQRTLRLFLADRSLRGGALGERAGQSPDR